MSSRVATAPRPRAPLPGRRPPPARTGRLRVGLLAPPWFPVPPVRYGGTEKVVALLAEGLADAGHRVVLFASADSTANVPLAPVLARAPSEQLGQTAPDLRHALACVEHAGEFDVIGDHSGPLGAVLSALVETPVLHTVHGSLAGDEGAIYDQVVRAAPRLGLVSLSLSQRRARPSLPWVANCPNAIDPSRYPLGRARGDYLLFLGRMGPEKGAGRAIAVARATGLPLKIAAKCRDPGERAYFAEHVEPQLGDGIEYVGEPEHEEAVELLRNARVTLFPVEWEEPFGLVMIESLACGTPVVATCRGSVPEVIEHGRTGIVVDRVDELPAAVAAAERIDPAECRRAVEERFGPDRLVACYVEAFRAALERAARADARAGSRARARGRTGARRGSAAR